MFIEVLHTPHITKNLLSVSKLTSDNNVIIEFDSFGYVKDKATRKLLLEGHPMDGLYEFKRHSSLESCLTAIVHNKGRKNNTAICPSSISVKEKWHWKLGHPSERVLNQVLQLCNVILNSNGSLFCEPCQFGKLHNLPFNLSLSRAHCPLALIHTDVWGPSLIQSTSGFKYYIQFLDDYYRHSWIYPLKHKGESLNAFKQFKILVENQKIKVLQSDGAGDFRSFTQYLVKAYSSDNLAHIP